MLLRTVLVMLFLFVAVPAAQAKSCYSTVEAEAEQGLRIHSELMVIGLNCQHMGKRYGMNLYGDYRSFTSKYSDLFAKYETVLMDYFKSRGDAKPVASLNTLRTNLANKISRDSAQMRPDVFCSKYAPRIEQASAMNLQDVRKWAATTYPSHPVSQPMCDG